MLLSLWTMRLPGQTLGSCIVQDFLDLPLPHKLVQHASNLSFHKAAWGGPPPPPLHHLLHSPSPPAHFPVAAPPVPYPCRYKIEYPALYATPENCPNEANRKKFNCVQVGAAGCDLLPASLWWVQQVV
jgi:hypothetical protein